jgi:Tol biopolymer transport system component
MSFVAPPRPPDVERSPQLDPLEALIEEARQRARRRRRTYGAVALVAVLGALNLVFVLGHDGVGVGSAGNDGAQTALPETLRDAEIVVTTHKANGVGDVVLWTPHGVEDLGVVGGWAVGLSPDGSRLLISSDVSQDGLDIVRTDGTKVASIPPAHFGDGAGETAVWSPDGSKVAYAAPPGFSSIYTERYRRLFVMDADGTNARRLPYYALGGPPHAGNVRWSPDGSMIAFAGVESPSTPYRRAIYVVRGDGVGPARRIAIDGGDVHRPSQPAWSPDGSKIAFTAVDERWSAALYVMNADGHNVRLVTGGGHDPVWSPDGTMLAFRSTGRYWTIRTDGSQRRVLTAPIEPSAGLSWSPDSRMLVYVGGDERFISGSGSDVFVVRADGTGRRRILHSSVLSYVSPIWRGGSSTGGSD